jgi:hypothetical protein
MRFERLLVFGIAFAVLGTSLVCSSLPVPPQLAPTIDPLQQAINLSLTDIALPTLTATVTLTFTPTATPEPSATPLPPTATPPKPGAISGNLSFPGGVIPSLRIVAIKVGDPFWKSVSMAQNSKAYQLNDLPPGTYWVVAYLQEPSKNDPAYGGGYSRAVTCGLTAKCTDHTLIPVEVKSGEVTKNIHPADWNAPRGTFPKNPAIP